MKKSKLELRTKTSEPLYYTLIFKDSSGTYHMAHAVGYGLDDTISRARADNDKLKYANLWWWSSESYTSIESKFKEFAY